ncbi:MAG: hypothetical protein MK074_03730 [Phycisphaerales bacterium]|nr:hypothetical protein [Phycisphaerales bacterium]
MSAPLRIPRIEDARGPREAVAFAALHERWHIPVLGRDSECMPYLSLEDDSPTLLLFTTRRKASQVVDGWIAPAVDTDVRVATCDRAAMATLLNKLLDRGISWARINHGPSTIRLPLESVAGAMRVVSQGQPLAPAQHLFILRDPITPASPFVEIVHEQPCLRLFMDYDRAVARAMTLGALIESPASAVVPVERDDLTVMLRRLRAQGVESIVLDGPGGSQWVGIDTALRDRLAA